MAKRGNNEGSIYYQKSRGRYAGALVGLDGKRQVLYAKTRQEVSKQLTKALQDRENGIPVPSQKHTVASYLAEWLENTIKPGRRPGTYLRYKTAVCLHITPAIGKVKLARLGPEHVQLMQKQLVDKGLGRSSIELVRATLSGALTQAVRWRFIVRNPVSLVDPPYTDDEDEPQPLLPEQATALLAAAAGHEFEQLFTLMLATGLRIGETLGLRWEDVDLDKKRLRVRQQLTILPGEAPQFTAPKSKSGRRTIPLIPAAVDALHKQRARVLEYRLRLPADWPTHDLVFPDEIGGPLVGRRAERVFKDMLTVANLPTTFTPHSLRHSTATYLMAMGVPARVIMEILGHSSISMTMKYQHVIESVLDDAAERLARIFPVATRVATH